MVAELPGNGNGVASWVRRIVAVANVVNKVGLPLFLVALGIATWYGWVASPFTGVPAVLREHDQNMIRLLDSKERLDTQVLATIFAMRTDMAKNSASYRLRVCSEIRDKGLRDRCLE